MKFQKIKFCLKIFARKIVLFFLEKVEQKEYKKHPGNPRKILKKLAKILDFQYSHLNSAGSIPVRNFGEFSFLFNNNSNSTYRRFFHNKDFFTYHISRYFNEWGGDIGWNPIWRFLWFLELLDLFEVSDPLISLCNTVSCSINRKIPPPPIII